MAARKMPEKVFVRILETTLACLTGDNFTENDVWLKTKVKLAQRFCTNMSNIIITLFKLFDKQCK